MKHSLTGFRFFNSVYWLALSLWLGALVMVTLTAAVIFPTMRDLDVVIPEFTQAGYVGNHWRIAAGHVMEILFYILDITQLICMTVALFVTALQFTVLGVSVRRFTHIARIGAVILASACALWHVFVLSPQMNTDLRAYWDSARKGDLAGAEVYQQAFDNAHPTAARLLGSTIVLVGVVIITSAAGVVPLKPANEMDDDQSSSGTGKTAKGTGIQEPELLRRLGV